MNKRFGTVVAMGVLLIAATAIAQEAPGTENSSDLAGGWSHGAEVSETRAASIQLDPSVDPPSTPVKVKGTGYQANESVKLTFDGSRVGKAKADARGKFSKRILVPASALPGNHTVEAKGLSSGLSSRATFTARTDWLQFCVDASRSCFNAYENLLSAENAGGIIIDWKTAVAADGSTSPAYGNGMVIAGTRDGVHALNTATGETIWAFAATGPFSSPAVIKGFNPQPDPPGKILVTSMDGNLYALSSVDGRLLWAAGIGATQVSPMISCLPPGPCKVVLAAGDTLFAYDENGNRLWAAVLGGVVTKATALLSNPPEPDKVIVAAGNTLSAVDLADGSVAWSVAPSRSFLGAPTIGDPGLLVGDEAGTLFAIDPADGSIAESFVLPGGGGVVSLALDPKRQISSPASSRSMSPGTSPRWIGTGGFP